jgi:serine/threonine protein phosphatase PrpC
MNNVILPGVSFRIDSANQPREQGCQSEDALLVTDGLLGVFDSVGGRDQGRLVSHLAGTTIMERWQALTEAERKAPPEHLADVLQTLLQQADTTIAALRIPAEQKRPATTAALCVLSVYQTLAYVTLAHIGDSRIYLLREGQALQRLTKDHGYFPFAVRHRKLTEEDALRIEQAEQADNLSPDDLPHFDRRNRITCAIGWSDFPFIPTCSLPLHPGDRILLCTDGLHDNLTDQEIEKILRASGEADAQDLVSAAYWRSQQKGTLRAKPDDISAIVALYPAQHISP